MGVGGGLRPQGVALIIAMLMLLVLTILALSVTFLAHTQTFTAITYRQTTQARYVAEAGVQRAMNWLASTGYPTPASANFNTTTYPVTCSATAISASLCSTGPIVLSCSSGTTNYPDSTNTTQTNFSSSLCSQTLTSNFPQMTFSIYATLLSMGGATGAVSWLGAGGSGPAQTWQITSVGTIAGTGVLRNSQVQVVEIYTRSFTPITKYAAFSTSTACPNLSLTAGSLTDSFSSSCLTASTPCTAGPSGNEYSNTASNSNGDVGSNGGLYMSSGGTKVNGVASFGVSSVTMGPSCPYNYENNGSGGATGGTVALGTAVPFPSPNYTNPSPALTGNAVTYSSNTTLPPGNYGNVVVSGGALSLSQGTYNFNSLEVSGGGSSITITSGPVVLELAGVNTDGKVPSCISWVAPPANPTYCVLEFDAGAQVINNTGYPSNFQIVYSGSLGIALLGGPGSMGVEYAPNAPTIISGGGAWYGALIANGINNPGGSPIHYDQNLQNTFGTIGNFAPVGFSWSKF